MYNMQYQHLKSLLVLAENTARDAAREVLKDVAAIRKVKVDLRRDVKIKADSKIEEFVVDRLTKQSEYPILSEESGLIGGSQEGSSYQWIVDPIDGSLNFSRGIPFCCISIALWNGAEPLLGVVLDFNRAEVFAGIVGDKATLNGKPIKVSDIKKKSKAILCTGFPVNTDFGSSALHQFVKQVQEYKKVRLLGSAALSLSYIASGRADIYIERDIKIWDVAAGCALVKASGGSVLIEWRKDITEPLTLIACNGRL